MKIGELANRTGCSIQTIRFYERQGLLAPPERSEGNFRLYANTAVQQLGFIKHCRSLDMTLDEIKQMQDLQQSPQLSCKSVDALIDRKLHQVEVRMQELAALKKTLQSMPRACEPGSAIADCDVLKHLKPSANEVHEFTVKQRH